MSAFLQYTFSGIVSGSLYALIALGMVLVFRASKTLFLIQGALVATASLTMIDLSQNHGIPTPVAAVVAIAVTVALAIVVEFVFIRRVPSSDTLNTIILLFGLLLLMAEGNRRTFGTANQQLNGYLPTNPIRVFGAAITPQQLLMIGSVGVLVLALWLLQAKTMVGKSLRACGDNPEGCELVGIRPVVVRTMAFGIAAVIAGLAGIITAPLYATNFDTGTILTVKGLVAGILGAWSFPGAIAAGLAVGLVEGFTVGYLSSNYQDVASLGFLVVFLVARTALGHRTPRVRALSSAVPDENLSKTGTVA